MRWLVVLLGFTDDDAQPMRLLPLWRLARTIQPRISRLARARQRRDNLGSGIRGERISEGHGQTLPDKKKYAMQKIKLELFRNVDRVSACPTPLPAHSHAHSADLPQQSAHLMTHPKEAALGG